MDKAKLEGWARGLLAAIVSGFAGGGSTGLTSMFVSPENFNVAHPELLVKMTIVACVVNSLIGGFAYLKQSPLPPE
jgi:uncharacterized membrane protein YfcA